MSDLFDSLCSERLQWLPEIGVGYYPVSDAAQPYDREYWDRYLGYDQTPVGHGLTDARLALVGRHWEGDLVDVGIGGGKFVRERPHTKGYDVNPWAAGWLRSIGLWCDPYDGHVHAATFWDSFEHIQNPGGILRNVGVFAFLSLPIFEGPEHVLRSKHYRRDEHYWYFTEAGLRYIMGMHGFQLVESNRMEQGCGREDIGTFVFKRPTCS